MDENKRFESGNISISAENMLPIIKKMAVFGKGYFHTRAGVELLGRDLKHARLVSRSRRPRPTTRRTVSPYAATRPPARSPSRITASA